jgi:hypothetical protein
MRKIQLQFIVQAEKAERELCWPYLIKVQDLTPGDAIRQTRTGRSGSIESKKQEIRLYEYREYVLRSKKNDSVNRND